MIRLFYIYTFFHCDRYDFHLYYDHILSIEKEHNNNNSVIERIDLGNFQADKYDDSQFNSSIQCRLDYNIFAKTNKYYIFYNGKLFFLTRQYFCLIFIKLDQLISKIRSGIKKK